MYEKKDKIKGPKPNKNLMWLLQLKTIKRCLYKYISNKMKTEDNLHHLLNAEENTG